MIGNADQIFVLLQYWVMHFFPSALQPVVGVLLASCSDHLCVSGIVRDFRSP